MVAVLEAPDQAGLDLILHQRRANGQDRWDECWDGRYIVLQPPSIEHFDVVKFLSRVFEWGVERDGGRFDAGCAVSDRVERWIENFRQPDVSVFLSGNSADPHRTHWAGGPDLAVEVVSPGDRTYEKLGFYAAVGTRELLIIDRDPWALATYQPQEGKMVETARVGVGDGPIALASLPATLELNAATRHPATVSLSIAYEGRAEAAEF